MLASITPLGERSRNNRYGLTVAAFVLGASVAGAALGAGLGAIGSAVVPAHGRWTFAAVALLALAGGAVDRLAPDGPPSWRRQVDETWLTRYRGWVYGVGYGAQLGAGVVTKVSSATVYLALALALLSGSLPGGIVIGSVFGLSRGLTVLLAVSAREPRQLHHLHRRLAAHGAVTSVAATGGQLLLALSAVTLAFW